MDLRWNAKIDLLRGRRLSSDGPFGKLGRPTATDLPNLVAGVILISRFDAVRCTSFVAPYVLQLSLRLFHATMNITANRRMLPSPLSPETRFDQPTILGSL